MKFYVIYSVDVPVGDDYFDIASSIAPYRPRARAWRMAEGDESYEYDYLGGIWSKGKHRKWVALLTRKQFDAWIGEVGLIPDYCETMGSITGIGHLPAISFHGDGDVIESAYVTPIPEIRGKEIENGTDRDWDRVRRAVIEFYK